MDSSKVDLIKKELQRLKEKHKTFEKAWHETGNRGLLQFFVDITPRLLNTERCSIFILDPKTERVWLQCGTDLKERSVKVPQAKSLVGEVISTGTYKIRSKLDSVTGTHGQIDNKTGFTTESVLGVPIFRAHSEEVIGVLQVLNKRGNLHFGSEDIKLLERMATQIQMNIESIYLRQEIIRVAEKMQRKIKKLQRALIKYDLKRSKDGETTGELLLSEELLGSSLVSNGLN
ncbi:MAG: GAF domain-containing protein [Candidatus Sedimenticola sp. PURPLELP]